MGSTQSPKRPALRWSSGASTKLCDKPHAGSCCHTAPTLLMQLKQLFLGTERVPRLPTNIVTSSNEAILGHSAGSKQAQTEVTNTLGVPAAPGHGSAGNTVHNCLSPSSISAPQTQSTALGKSQPAGASGSSPDDSASMFPSPDFTESVANSSSCCFNVSCNLFSLQVANCGSGQLPLLQEQQQEPGQHLQQDELCLACTSSRYSATMAAKPSLAPVQQQISLKEYTHASGNLIISISRGPPLITSCRSSGITEPAGRWLQEQPTNNVSAEQLQPQLAAADACSQVPMNCKGDSQAVFPIYAGHAAACSGVAATAGSSGSIPPPAPPMRPMSRGTPAHCSATDSNSAATALFSDRQLPALGGGRHVQGLVPMSVYLDAVCPDTLLAEWQAQDEDEEVSSPTGRTLMELQDEQGLLQQQPAEIGSQWLEPDPSPGGTCTGSENELSSTGLVLTGSTVPTETQAPTAQVQTVLRLSVLGPIMQTVAVNEGPLAQQRFGGGEPARQLLSAEARDSWFTDEWPEHVGGPVVDEYGRSVYVLRSDCTVLRGNKGVVFNLRGSGQQGLGHRQDETHGGVPGEDCGFAEVGEGAFQGQEASFVLSPSKDSAYNGLQVPRPATS